MLKNEAIELLMQVANGGVSPEAAADAFANAPFTDLGFAKVDHHRALRQGSYEVIFGLGKTNAQISAIALNMREHGAKNIIVTRVSGETAGFLQNSPGGIDCEYFETAQIAVLFPDYPSKTGNITVAAAGTSDLRVAEEAAVTAEVLGNNVTRMYDVGVAGIHRLLAQLDKLREARCVIAVAGMEGALASVIGGLVAVPVIAVPTSVGYGANLGGLSALLTMLNSCSAGVTVVNIDNGFGAGYTASMVNKM